MFYRNIINTTMKSIKSTVTLNDGVVMPIFGLGVYKLQPESTVIEAVQSALKYGYRLIDTAEFYE